MTLTTGTKLVLFGFYFGIMAGYIIRMIQEKFEKKGE